MIAIDTNVLVYAHVPQEPRHAAAFAALRQRALSGNAWGVPAPCLAEFVRVLSHPRIHNQPLPDVMDAVQVLLALPGAMLLLPDGHFAVTLDRLCREAGSAGNAIFDAQIAAVCLANNVEAILSEDRGFSRFRELRVLRLADALSENQR